MINIHHKQDPMPSNAIKEVSQRYTNDERTLHERVGRPRCSPMTLYTKTDPVKLTLRPSKYVAAQTISDKTFRCGNYDTLILNA